MIAGGNLNNGRFLSTPSARRATRLSRSSSVALSRFLSTPSARRATRPHSGHQRGPSISIHALREEGDGLCSAYFMAT